MIKSISYTATNTFTKFMRDDSFLRILEGEVGSGKTTACIMEIFKRCAEMPQQADGIRRSRWAVIAPTRMRAKDGVMLSWRSWFEGFGVFSPDKRSFVLKFDDVEASIYFRGAEEIRDLLSMEFTGAFIDSIDECSPEVLAPLAGRVGRYPRIQEVSNFWYGVIANTTEALHSHKVWGRELPEEFGFLPGTTYYRQPEGDNAHNLPDGYYQRLNRLRGKK